MKREKALSVVRGQSDEELGLWRETGWLWSLALPCVILGHLLYCLPKLPTNHLYSIQSFKLDVISTLKIRKLSHREVKQLSYRCYTVNQLVELGLEHGSV